MFAGFVASKVATIVTLPTRRAIGSGRSEDSRPQDADLNKKTAGFPATYALLRSSVAGTRLRLWGRYLGLLDDSRFSRSALYAARPTLF